MAEVEVEIPEVLVRVLEFCIEDAKERLKPGEDLVPFTALAVGDTLFTEDQEADSVPECYAKAQNVVAHASGARAYGFCYDGYVNLDSGTVDALIAEGGVPGAEDGHAFALVYTFDSNRARNYADQVQYIGPTDNFMADLAVVDEGEPEEESAEPAE